MVLQNDAPIVLDVRFSAHGSPYKSPVLLNGLIAQHRGELEQVIGATIVSAGIDMCKFTVCDKGCQTINHADGVSSLLYLSQTFRKFLLLAYLVNVGIVHKPAWYAVNNAP